MLCQLLNVIGVISTRTLILCSQCFFFPIFVLLNYLHLDPPLSLFPPATPHKRTTDHNHWSSRYETYSLCARVSVPSWTTPVNFWSWSITQIFCTILRFPFIAVEFMNIINHNLPYWWSSREFMWFLWSGLHSWVVPHSPCVSWRRISPLGHLLNIFLGGAWAITNVNCLHYLCYWTWLGVYETGVQYGGPAADICASSLHPKAFASRYAL